MIATGLLGQKPYNAADYQVATSVRLLLTTEDVRPLVEGRPAADHAMRICPTYPGHAPAALPPEWSSQA